MRPFAHPSQRSAQTLSPAALPKPFDRGRFARSRPFAHPSQCSAQTLSPAALPKPFDRGGFARSRPPARFLHQIRHRRPSHPVSVDSSPLICTRYLI
jgi:hypothetical protein